MSKWDEEKQAVTEATQEEFGDPVLYSQSGRADKIATAIFTERFQEVSLGGEVPVMSTSPVFDIQIADIGFKSLKGDVITRENSDAYEVVRTELDGEGGVRLFCTRRR